MKLKKKTAIIAGFTVGTLLFATTAFADIVSKSGYDQFKDGVKISAEKASSEYDSFTMEMTAVLKANGKVLESNSGVEKFDRVKNAQERTSTSENSLGEVTNYYTYSDNSTVIRKGSDSDKIYVGEYPEGREYQGFNNPFEEEEFNDVERIIDAVVGSLKDHVIAKENPDGTKELSGSLSEMQIPTLVNAVSSFALKQEFHDSRIKTGWPNLTQDITVKEVTGSALINEEGAMENILATMTMTGKDPQGQVHELTLEILGTIKDINSTVVAKPDMTGKEVVKEIVKDHASINNPQKFVGTFKNDIVTEKEGKFVKVGERILEITQVNDQEVAGRYYEVYKPGYEDSGKIQEFSFSAPFNDKSLRDANFVTAGQDGITEKSGHIYLDDYAGKVNFYINSDSMSMGSMFDSTFNPVLE